MCKCATLMMVLLGVIVVATVIWHRGLTPDAASQTVEPAAKPAALRLALVPERDIFEQRHRYIELADYLTPRLGEPVEIVTLNTYEAVLQDMAEGNVEAAFIGSLVGALAIDRLDARPLVKPLLPGGVSTYRGVVFVAADSPIQSIEDLAGKTIAMVRTTTAGELFPLALMREHGLLEGPDVPNVIWVGTHDDVILEVMTGRVDAGAAKNLRIDAFHRRHPDFRVRRLAESAAVPNNALIVSPKAAAVWGAALREALLAMHEDAAGRAVLDRFGAQRFIVCEAGEFDAVAVMAQGLGSTWERMEVSGPPPRRRLTEAGAASTEPSPSDQTPGG